MEVETVGEIQAMSPHTHIFFFIIVFLGYEVRN